MPGVQKMETGLWKDWEHSVGLIRETDGSAGWRVQLPSTAVEGRLNAMSVRCGWKGNVLANFRRGETQSTVRV